MNDLLFAVAIAIPSVCIGVVAGWYLHVIVRALVAGDKE